MFSEERLRYMSRIVDEPYFTHSVYSALTTGIQVKCPKCHGAGVVTADEDKWNLLVRDTETGLLNPSFPGTEKENVGEDYNVELTGDKGKIPYAQGAENKKTFSFYVNETAQENQEDGIGDMTLLVEVEEVDTDEEPKETNFFFVRRNDLLRFPILVSTAISG